MKQFQNKKQTPRTNDLSARMGFHCTHDMRAAVIAAGGSAWVRAVVQRALQDRPNRPNKAP